MAFVEAYLELGFNATRAAIAAGYSAKTAYSQGPRLLKNVEVAKRIQTRLADAAMSADEVLARLSDLARGSMEDFISFPKGAVKGDVLGTSLHLDLVQARDRGKLHLVRKLTDGDEGVKVELYDARAALVDLGRHHGLFVDREELTGKDGAPLEMVDAKARLLSKFANRDAGDGADRAPGKP